MKKILVLAVLMTFGLAMLVPDAMGQTRRRSKYRGWKTNAAIIGGSALAGGLIGRGRNGALIGAGAGALYATSRKGMKRSHPNSAARRWTKVAGGTLVGAGTGAAIGGKTGLIVGSLAGAGGTYLYTRNGRRYYRSSNGRQFYTQNGRRYYVR